MTGRRRLELVSSTVRPAQPARVQEVVTSNQVAANSPMATVEAMALVLMSMSPLRLAVRLEVSPADYLRIDNAFDDNARIHGRPAGDPIQQFMGITIVGRDGLPDGHGEVVNSDGSRAPFRF